MNQIEQHKPYDKWSHEKKVECAIAVMAYGSIEKAAKQCNISSRTLGHWSRNDDGFNEVLVSIQLEKSFDAQHTYGLIVHKAQKVTLDKLGEATAAQASLIACQAQDKQLLLQGKPTSIRGDSESMKDLAAKFAQLSEEHMIIKQDHENIQGSVVQTKERPG